MILNFQRNKITDEQKLSFTRRSFLKKSVSQNSISRLALATCKKNRKFEIEDLFDMPEPKRNLYISTSKTRPSTSSNARKNDSEIVRPFTAEISKFPESNSHKYLKNPNLNHNFTFQTFNLTKQKLTQFIYNPTFTEKSSGHSRKIEIKILKNPLNR